MCANFYSFPLSPSLYAVSPEGSVEVSPVDPVLPHGNFVVFNCTSRGGPNNFISWTYNGNQIITEGPSNLLYRFVSVSNSGEYTCTVSNDAGSGRATTTLYITPTISTGPADISANVNETVMFSCSVSGFPTPVITWEYQGNTDATQSSSGGFGSGLFDDGFILGSGVNNDGLFGEDYTINTSEKPGSSNSTLVIFNTTYGYYGVYRCIASSMINMQIFTTSSNATLHGESPT